MANTPDSNLHLDEPEPVECEGDEIIACDEEDLAPEATETGFTLVPEVSFGARDRVASVVIGKPKSN